jgi:hypothetical protein
MDATPRACKQGDRKSRQTPVPEQGRQKASDAHRAPPIPATPAAKNRPSRTTTHPRTSTYRRPAAPPAALARTSTAGRAGLALLRRSPADAPVPAGGTAPLSPPPTRLASPSRPREDTGNILGLFSGLAVAGARVSAKRGRPLRQPPAVEPSHKRSYAPQLPSWTHATSTLRACDWTEARTCVRMRCGIAEPAAQVHVVIGRARAEGSKQCCHRILYGLRGSRTCPQSLWYRSHRPPTVA